jgi:Phage integrase family
MWWAAPRVEVRPRLLQAAARRAGLPATLRFYDLRHTAASLLIREGASIKAVQKQLGHATASITLDAYGHLFPTSWTRWSAGWSALQRGARGPGTDPARTTGCPAPGSAGQ